MTKFSRKRPSGARSPRAALMPAFLAEERPPFGFEMTRRDFTAGGEGLDNLASSVGRAVVDNNHFQTIDGLLEERAQALLDEAFHVERGNHDGYGDLIRQELVHGVVIFFALAVPPRSARPELAQDRAGRAALIACCRRDQRWWGGPQVLDPRLKERERVNLSRATPKA